MFRRKPAMALAATATTILLAGVSACSSSSASSSGSGSMPTVTMMVGGIDKQIYLPYQLAQGLGYYKKYGVNMQLSTEQQGGVGAEDAVVAGQVDFAGAWYVHTINFQLAHKSVISVAQLSGAPGEREMCYQGANITSPAQWRGKSVGVTDLGSGTDQLTQYLAARFHLTTKQYTRVAAGDGDTMIAALQQHRIVCGMTTQPTVSALEKRGVAYPAFDLATSAGVQKWLGGFWPSAAVLARTSWVNANRATVQKVVDALVATMHYIATHSAAQIASHLPASFVSNSLISRADYDTALTQDKAQFLPNGMMPAGGPQTVYAVEKVAGQITGPVNLASTYTNAYVIKANKLEGYTK
jgi:NitT/TauT family transport system substrate-binding protein